MTKILNKQRFLARLNEKSPHNRQFFAKLDHNFNVFSTFGQICPRRFA